MGKISTDIIPCIDINFSTLLKKDLQDLILVMTASCVEKSVPLLDTSLVVVGWLGDGVEEKEEEEQYLIQSLK